MSMACCENCGDMTDTDFNVEWSREPLDLFLCDGCFEGTEHEALIDFINGDMSEAELGMNLLLKYDFRVDDAGALINETKEKFMGPPS